MKALTVKILTPDGALYDGPAEAVHLPGSASPFEVLPGHAALVSTLDEGIVRVMTGGGEKRFGLHSGAVRIENDIITVCADV